MKKKSTLFDKFYTFDIETTSYITGVEKKTGNLKKEGILYSGQFYDGVTYTQVRTLREVISFFKNIEKEVPEGKKIAIYVHNLQFEIQFIKNFFHWEKILANSPRRIISIETEKLCFRCSYFLSNMSLDKFLKAEGVEETFLKTTLNYDKDRFPWTELSEDEKTYMKNDVVGLHKAICNMMVKNNIPSLNKLPLTNTGFVRTECRKNMQTNYKNRYWFKDNIMDYETFVMCNTAFRGGNTHANRYYSTTLLHNVASFDIASSYPYVLLAYKFPRHFWNINSLDEKEFHMYYDNPEKYAMLIDVTFEKLVIHDEVSIPYISYSKCSKVTNSLNDNGRILTCDMARMIITEVDLDIILNQYDYESLNFHRIKVALKCEIPEEFKNTILDYYTKKCTLKGVDDYYYMKSKNRLNSLYGMSVTNPIKGDYEFLDGCFTQAEFNPEEKLEQYNNSWSSFIPYQVGVWVTAYARKRLQDIIDIVNADMVYCDTDSVKFLNPEKYIDKIESYNDTVRKINAEKQLFVDYNNKRFYIGVYEDEGIYTRFKTFGAKKYLTEKNGDYEITIAGVPKKQGKECIFNEIKKGNINDFFDIDIGFTFKGIKNTVEFNDYTELKQLDIEGKTVEYSSNCAFYDCDYTLGLASEYEILLRWINEIR